MIMTIKVMLIPNNKQATKLFATAGAARFAYNWAVAMQDDRHQDGEKLLHDRELRKLFTTLKDDTSHAWLYEYSNNATKQAIIDACNAYKRYLEGVSSYPRFKSRRRTKPSFYVDPGKIKITDTHVKLEKLTTDRRKNRQVLNWIRLAEKGRIPKDAKCLNPRVSYDGNRWWLAVGIETVSKKCETTFSDGIGIDVGIKNLAVCSDGALYPSMNQLSQIKKIKRKKHRLKQQITRKYSKNREGESYRKTKNILKTEQKLKEVNRHLTNIRHNHLHQVTTEIVNRKPRFIVLEDLDVKAMMKEVQLSGGIWEQEFSRLYRQISYKSEIKGITLITADRYFPSSKLCSCCGTIKKDLSLSDRMYVCECGNVIDRDYQAALNLMRYGRHMMQSA